MLMEWKEFLSERRAVNEMLVYRKRRREKENYRVRRKAGLYDRYMERR